MTAAYFRHYITNNASLVLPNLATAVPRVKRTSYKDVLTKKQTLKVTTVCFRQIPLFVNIQTY